MDDMMIRKAEGGYIVTYPDGTEKVTTTLESAFDWLLLHFEGKASTFQGDSYGRVVIEHGEKQDA